MRDKLPRSTYRRIDDCDFAPLHFAALLNVSREVSALCEAHGAVGALVGARACVRAPVPRQLVARAERLGAALAVERPLAAVHAFVYLQRNKQVDTHEREETKRNTKKSHRRHSDVDATHSACCCATSKPRLSSNQQWDVDPFEQSTTPFFCSWCPRQKLFVALFAFMFWDAHLRRVRP